MKIVIIMLLVGILSGCATSFPEYDATVHIGPSKQLGSFIVTCAVCQALPGKPSHELGTATNTVRSGLEESFLVSGESEDDGAVCSVLAEQGDGHMSATYRVSISRHGREVWSSMQSMSLVPFDEWQTDETNKPVIDAQLLSPGMAIAGKWVFTDGRYFGTDLTLLPSRDGYIADFRAWGCTGEINLARRASFTGAVVRLDEPVTDFWPNTYRELYAVRVSNKDYLVPDCVVQSFKEGLTPDHTVVTNLAWHVLEKRAEPPAGGDGKPAPQP